jgi:asparagine synthase (glutamine-hydrolysing)
MCGIAGIVKFTQSERAERNRLQRMCDVLWHRGPDDGAVVVAGNAGLAHRRLAIIDLAGGRQPMSNASGTVWISYNGELYNFRELRAELESQGCVFTTRSDTEVVLRAYEVFGEACVERLRGMFAFAIWDGAWGRLFLARDRLGIKPLYYIVTDDEILFASEIKAILTAIRRRPGMNQFILPEYLATGFVSGSETFFEGIRKLMPGRTLSWSSVDGFQERRYWRLPDEVDKSITSLKQHADGVRDRLEEAVSCHLVSDVPLGVFLSGGLDSSGLAAIIASIKDEPLCTFAVGFSEGGFSELEYARRMAGAIGAEHRDIVITPADFFSALPSLTWHEDEPIAFPSSVPLYFVSRLARKHVKVVMTGEGADELFLGYNRYRVAAWNERLSRTWNALMPGFVRRGVGNLIPELPISLRRYAERTFLAQGESMRELFYENFAVFSRHHREGLLAGSELIPARDPYEEALRRYGDAPAGTLERMMHADLQTYLVELLMKQDQMSMAASIESRVPFLDHEFVDYVAQIPGHYKLRGWRTKMVLREALAELVPPEILSRRKMGFPVPLKHWFRDAYWPLVQDLVLGGRARDRGLFSHKYAARLVEEHRSGVWNHGHRLWLLIGLEIWQRIFIDGEAASSVLGSVERAA